MCSFINYSWFINPQYYMLDKYRKELVIEWNSNGFVSSNVITG